MVQKPKPEYEALPQAQPQAQVASGGSYSRLDRRFVTKPAEHVVQDAPELAQPFAYIRPRKRRRSGRSGRPYPVVQDAPVPSMMQEAPVPEHEAKQQAQGSEAAEEEAVPLSQWAVPNAAVLLPLQDPQQDEEQWPDDQELAQALIMLHSRLEMS